MKQNIEIQNERIEQLQKEVSAIYPFGNSQPRSMLCRTPDLFTSGIKQNDQSILNESTSKYANQSRTYENLYSDFVYQTIPKEHRAQNEEPSPNERKRKNMKVHVKESITIANTTFQESIRTQADDFLDRSA